MSGRLENRRRFTRVPCVAKVILEASEQLSLGRLTDLGVGGLGVLAQEGFCKAGDLIKIRPVVQSQRWPPVAYEVRWCHPSDQPGWVNLGLCFPGTILEFMNSWVPSLFIGLDFGKKQLLERREHIRVELQGEALLKDRKGNVYQAEILNLGTGGALLCSKDSWDAEEEYLIDIVLLSNEVLPLKAKVAGSQQLDERCLYRVIFCDNKPQALDRLSAYIAGMLAVSQKIN